MKRFVIFLFFISILSELFAQHAKETIDFRVNLRDGNVMIGKSNITVISLITDFGKLEIPVKYVSSVEFGITPDNADKQKIYLLLNNLGARNIPKNSDAYNQLVNMPVGAIPVIEDYIANRTEGPDSVSEYTAENALNDLKYKFNLTGNYSTKDIVIFDENYNIGGFYDLKSISLKTEYGELQINRDKILKIEVMYASSDDTERKFVLNANKHIYSNTNGGWMNTGISVQQGQNISISASGEVSFASLSGYKYTPDGKTTSNKYNDSYYDYTSSTYPSYGNVVFKIGESGTMMKAGDKYTGRAATSGILYISIYEVVFNAANTGSYTVKIKVK